MIGAPLGYFLISVFKGSDRPWHHAQVIIGWRVAENGAVSPITLAQTHIGAWDTAIELPDGRIVDCGTGGVEWESRAAFLDSAFQGIAEEIEDEQNIVGTTA